MADSQSLACNRNDHLGQWPDCYHLVGSNVDRAAEIRFHETPHPVQTFVNIEEGSGLEAVSPDLAVSQRWMPFGRVI